MPIAAHNRHRYPSNWKAIRAQILERAGNRCEECGVPNYAFRPARKYFWTFDVGLAEAWICDGHKVSKIVLTIAHLDHTPEHNDPKNLRAWCQRCHNRYDAPHRKVNAHYTRRRKSGAPDLFDDSRTKNQRHERPAT
ncbi:MAG: hypothetical protein ABTR07_04110 [Candidatus Competibacter denitrificans]